MSSPSDPTGARRARWTLFVCIAAALLLPELNFSLFGREGVNMRDEGYLWYGVRAVLAGQVPLRDFQAYDPGRYYWCAFLSPLFGDGLLGVRASSALFQVFGLLAGLLALRRVLHSPLALLVAGAALTLWMFPRHKLYESSITMVGVWAAVRLVELPSARRAFVGGLVVGACAFFGRNHGLYLGLAFLALALGLPLAPSGPSRLRRLVATGLGVLVGYGPMLGMFALVPGFARGFWDATLLVLEQGANLPVPYPLPWNTELRGAGDVGLVLAFLLPFLVLPAALVALLRGRLGRDEEGAPRPARALLLASFVVAVPYLHHFAVRSDLSHLAQSSPPLLFAAVALGVLAPARPVRGAVWASLLVLTALVQVRRHPFVVELLRDEPVDRVEHAFGDGAQLGREEVLLKRSLARHLARVQWLIRTRVEDDELFVAPTSPSFYPIFGKLSPDWWIYYLWPATEEQQRATIQRLEERGVKWALIVHRNFDQDESFSFEETNPLVLEWIQREFEVHEDTLVRARDYTLYRRRD